jgi:hypothetical protein
MRPIAMVHDRIGGETGMGRAVGDMVRAALEGGRDVTLVAAEVESDLRGECRVFEVPAAERRDIVWQREWAPAALAAAAAGHIVHGHLAPLAGRADVMTCHHLARAAAEHGVPVDDDVLAFDDDSYARPGELTFVSAFLRDECSRLYGRTGAVTGPVAPPWDPVDRVPGRRIVVGYAGGDDARKGVDAVRSLGGEDDIELVVAGPHAERIDIPAARVDGWVDVCAFAATVDVIVAPSLFDAVPFAALQALSRGTPVVVGPATGVADAVRRHGAGVVWDATGSLADAVRAAARVERNRCERVIGEFGADAQRQALLAVYERLDSLPRP